MIFLLFPLMDHLMIRWSVVEFGFQTVHQSISLLCDSTVIFIMTYVLFQTSVNHRMEQADLPYASNYSALYFLSFPPVISSGQTLSKYLLKQFLLFEFP